MHRSNLLVCGSCSRAAFLIAVVFASISTLLGAQSWTTSHGLDTHYRPPQYLSGYGFSDLPDSGERFNAARNDALAALSRQVRTRITSSEDIRTIDDADGTRSRYSNTTQTATDLQITGAQYEIAERRQTTHVLAWIELEELRGQFLNEGTDARARLNVALQSFDRAMTLGDMDGAERALSRADGALSAIYDATTIARALDALAGRSIGSVAALAREAGTGRANMINPLEKERLLQTRRDQLSRFQPVDPVQGAAFLARNLISVLRELDPAGSRSGGRGTQVMPLLYQDADFSSAFGMRMAGLISTSLSQVSTREDTPVLDSVVIRGSYWPQENHVELQLTAREIQSGRVVAAAHTSIPKNSVDAATLLPANADVALSGARELLNNQLVFGGLELNIWTDKGRNESALVFEEGEVIQFYFQVNQPAFLQISYVLASGETVLLEEKFYIGIDRVNRVVALPYRFQVVPPFGVERLIVTAHSIEPPPPDVVPRQISGQWYEVFRTPGDAVVRTRGLAREPATDGGGTNPAGRTRVGEAHLSITTVAGNR